MPDLNLIYQAVLRYWWKQSVMMMQTLTDDTDDRGQSSPFWLRSIDTGYTTRMKLHFHLWNTHNRTITLHAFFLAYITISQC